MFYRLLAEGITAIGFSKEDYYNLCRCFLYSMFNIEHNGRSHYLVLDQAVQTLGVGVGYCRNFIPNMKNIVVWRDPRDIYTIAKTHNIQWLPHDTVEQFINSRKRTYALINKDDNERLTVRFEDLIFNYDNIVGKIEKYLGLSEHTHPQSCLDISVSSRGCRTWENKNGIPKSDYERILNAMPEFCYTI